MVGVWVVAFLYALMSVSSCSDCNSIPLGSTLTKQENRYLEKKKNNPSIALTHITFLKLMNALVKENIKSLDFKYK